jgi:hypothetical protein
LGVRVNPQSLGQGELLKPGIEIQTPWCGSHSNPMCLHEIGDGSIWETRTAWLDVRR